MDGQTERQTGRQFLRRAPTAIGSGSIMTPLFVYKHSEVQPVVLMTQMALNGLRLQSVSDFTFM